MFPRPAAITAPLLALGLGACGQAAEPPGLPRRPSIVLVSFDTLRADHLGAYGDARGLTPNLDAFARDAVLFERAYSQANATTASHTSLFTSRYPSELGVTTVDRMAGEGAPFLAEILRLYDYHTGSSVAGMQLSDEFGLARGFDWHEETGPMGSLQYTAPPALSWLDSLEEEEPFLLFLHGYDAHDRYLKPNPWGGAWTDPGYRGPAQAIVQRTRRIHNVALDWAFLDGHEPLWSLHHRIRIWDEAFRGEVRAWARANPGFVEPFGPRDTAYVQAIYAGAVAWSDAWFGWFMAGLEQRGLLDDCVVVVLSDHGEALGEHGYISHSMSTHDEELHVPLMIRHPDGRGAGTRVDSPVALLDLLPTLLALADVPAPAGIHGRSLQPAFEGRPLEPRLVFSEGPYNQLSVRSAEHRLSFGGMRSDSPWLAPVLASAAIDGPAFAEASTGSVEQREQLRQALVAWRTDLRIGSSAVVSEEARRALREQGYWVAGEDAP
jgi:arylsulfatase A-like enzyme